MKLNASTFISIVLAFLVFMGYSGQPVVRVESPIPPDFTYTFRQEGPSLPNKVRIDAFDDLTCADCTDFAKNTLPRIKALAQETGKIDLHLYVVPDINDEPLYESALALKCAADQEHFWDLYEKIHDNKEDLSAKSLIGLGKGLGLNTEALTDCMEAKVHEKAVQDDIEYASLNQVMVKPTLLINEYKLIGQQPFENIKKVISGYLEDDKPAIEEEVKTDLKEELEGLDLPITNL
ncbi:thioredoxin domain-containing protein [Candidatus Peregrinibacteria bacterium]|nr:thioredoxin domain-containing protein [Candidatus Peregrinibacteria bacterium]